VIAKDDLTTAIIENLVHEGTLIDTAKSSKSIDQKKENQAYLQETTDNQDENSLQLRYVGKISIQRPAYLQLSISGNTTSLWVSQFSLTRTGTVTRLNIEQPNNPQRLRNSPDSVWKEVKSTFAWPNEIATVPAGTIQGLDASAVVVSDGFLMPGKCDGGIYIVANPGLANESTVQISGETPGWFYHKAVWVDLLNTGRPGLLAARAKKPIIGQAEGELVFFEQPNVLHALEAYSTPWRETVITQGPDVMFEVVDLDPDDDSVEIIAAEFFSERLTLTSVTSRNGWFGQKQLEVKQKLVLDNDVGPAYGVTAANLLTGNPEDKPTHLLVTSHACQYDLDSDFSVEEITCGSEQAGAGVLYAYEIPTANWLGGATGGGTEGWRGWKRSVIASGFRVHGLGINPGAPGFVYTFHPRKSMQGKAPPYIAVAGDCAQAAYILAPVSTESFTLDPTHYETLCMISCEGTVGSLAFGYLQIPGDDDFQLDSTKDEWIKIFIPSYDQDKIYIFEMTNKEQGRYHFKALKWKEGVCVDTPW